MPRPQHGALGLAFTATRALQLMCIITVMGMTARFISELVDNSETPPAPLVAVLSLSCLAIIYVVITYILYWDSQLPYLPTIILDSIFFLALMIASIIIGKPLSMLSCGSDTGSSSNTTSDKVQTVLSDLVSPTSTAAATATAASSVAVQAVTTATAAASAAAASVQAFAETSYQTVTATATAAATSVLPNTLVAATLAPGASGTEVTGSNGQTYQVIGERAVDVVRSMYSPLDSDHSFSSPLSNPDLYGISLKVRDVTEAVMNAIDYDAWVRTSGRTCMMMKAVWGFNIAMTVLFVFSAACLGFLWKRQRDAANGVKIEESGE